MAISSAARTPIETWHRVTRRHVPDWDVLRERIELQSDAPAVALWLVRHGESTTNARELITGTTDAPLTTRGRHQARAAGVELTGLSVDLALSSQLRRSREALELMVKAGRLYVDDSVTDARLAERSLGALELTRRRPAGSAPPTIDAAPARGESYLALARRCLSFLLDVRELAAELDRPATLLVSTHQGPMRIFAGILERTADPVDVLARMFDNSRPARMELGRLAFPAFVCDTSEG